MPNLTQGYRPDGMVRYDGAPPPGDFTPDAALLRRLLAEQCPRLADEGVELAAVGWDNCTFRIGAHLAARLPRRDVAVPLIGNEQRWLPELAPALPVEVPVPCHNGVPGAGYPWPWSIVPWIEGVTALDEPLDAAASAEFARFLRSLHTLDVPGDAPINAYRGGSLTGRKEILLGRLASLRAARAELDGQLLVRLFDAAVEAPVDTNPAWLHGDLHHKNVIGREGRLAGVIDWGDLCAGDPATDLAALYLLFDDDAHHDFWEAYEQITPATHLRTLGWAISFAAMVWDSHHTAEPAFAARGLRALRRVTASPHSAKV